MLFLVALAAALEPPRYGMDLSLGYGVGTLLNRWSDPGPHGTVNLRLDLFPVDLHVPGGRVGASIWARSSAWPGPEASELVNDVSSRFPYDYQQYGLHFVFRSDPAVAWGGTFGFGFSRLDLENYHDGVLTLPFFSVEGGVRRNIGRGFVDLMAHGGESTARNEVGGWEEWWNVHAVLAAGVHLR